MDRNSKRIWTDTELSCPTLPLTGKPMTIADVAERFGVHRQTIMRWERQGRLRGHWIGGRVKRFLVAEVAALERDL
ncbi:MAG: helix-turn-helix domain-containing protein [Puniceicoccales bacterium]